MFIEMRRKKQQISMEESIRVLKESKRGVLSVVGEEGYPYGVPVNFFYDENDNTIYLHTATEGHKINAINNCNKVSFTTWDNGYKEPGDWAWYVTSVIVRGKAEIINNIEIMKEKIMKLGVKFTNAEEVQSMINRNISKVNVIAIHIDNITGKLVHEK